MIGEYRVLMMILVLFIIAAGIGSTIKDDVTLIAGIVGAVVVLVMMAVLAYLDRSGKP